MVPRRMLLATDGSPAALRAEEFAADMAKLMGSCELVVTTVIEVRPRPARAGGTEYPRAEEREEAEELVDGAKQRLEATLTGTEAKISTAVVEASSPAAGIVDQSHASEGCSLIIMGNRGLGGLSSLVLGSTSDQVLHESDCPVVVIR
jgi:nucleotide-binding universal stress UspA family protein